MDISESTLRVLLFLAPGFLGFRLYMIDADWSAIRQLDLVYGSLIFSALGYLCYAGFLAATGATHVAWFVVVSFASAIAIALIWKKYGHTALHKLLSKLKLTNEDNRGDVWQKIFNDPQLYVTQITAYLKNGEVIQCDDTAAYDRPELREKGIFPYYSHRDGQIYFVPTLRKAAAPGSQWEPVDDIEAAEDWGIRLVYVTPAELQRLELRVTPCKMQNA